MGGYFQTKSQEAIAKAVRYLPKHADYYTVRKAVDAMYPFQSMQGWPYKAWCGQRTKYLRRRFPPQPPASPLFDKPHERPIPSACRPAVAVNGQISRLFRA
jgi:hypothetical protein